MIAICSAYYVFPIQNKNNIAAPELQSRNVETSTYKRWRLYYQLLDEGNCFKALSTYSNSPRLHEDTFWFARMLSLGICLPKDEELAYATIQRAANEGYVYDIFHLGYLTEKGIGITEDQNDAKEIYVHAFKQLNNLDEGDLEYITDEFPYLFYGENGTEILKNSFTIALQQQKLKE